LLSKSKLGAILPSWGAAVLRPYKKAAPPKSKLGRCQMQSAVIKDPNILGGEPVFRGTRVPFKILTEYLEGGDTLEQFLDQYPSVSRELAIAAIEEARRQ
jgi:uncharacterized protein (DUF433 family)